MDSPEDNDDERVLIPDSLLEHISNVDIAEQHTNAIKNLVDEARWFADRYAITRGLLEEALNKARVGLAPTFCSQCKNYWWVTHSSLESIEAEKNALCKRCSAEEA